LASDFAALTACNDFPRRIGDGWRRLGFAIHFFSECQVRFSVGDGPQTSGFFILPAPDCRSSAAFPQLALPNFIG
jgi:hypothetical protein